MSGSLRFAFLILALILLPAGMAMGQAELIEFTGTEQLQSPVPADWGSVFCPGGTFGQWPPLTAPPCSEGSRFHVRDILWKYNLVTDDDHMVGVEEVRFNGNFDAFTLVGPGSGQMWGTFVIKVMSGGVETGEQWVGTWTGRRLVTEDGAYAWVRAEGIGTGGSIEGWKVRWNSEYEPPATTSTVTGWILVPPEKK